MKRSRFSEEQIIGILTEHEAGATCADLCRKHGMSEGTFYIYGRLPLCKLFEAVSDR
jgi:transposase-like protein